MASLTFVSTANAFALRGARPVFADIRPDTLNLDERLLEFPRSPRSPGRRSSAHAFFPFEQCESLSARLIVERWHENPWLTGVVLPLTLSRPVKGLLF